MNADRLFFIRGMIPGLIPLVIFLLADSIFGTKVGLIASIVLGIIELAVIYLREKRIERFVLFDLGMIIFFAGTSLLLENDIFFKLKPAVMELVLCVILGVSAFTPANILQLMTMRYLKGMTLNEAAARKMRQSCAVMFVLFLAHTMLIVIAAFFMSNAAWGFISGVMFYLIFGAYMAAEVLIARKQKRAYMKARANTPRL